MDKQSMARYDPTINLGHILQTVILVSAVSLGYTATQLQINSNTKDIDALKKENRMAKEEFIRFKDQVRDDLRDVRNEVKDVNSNVLEVLSRMPDK